MEKKFLVKVARLDMLPVPSPPTDHDHHLYGYASNVAVGAADPYHHPAGDEPTSAPTFLIKFPFFVWTLFYSSSFSSPVAYGNSAAWKAVLIRVIAKS